MIPFIGYLTKPVVLVLVGVVLTGGALAGLYKWSNDRCEVTLQEAVNEAEIKAKKERARITENFLRDQRGYEARLRVLRGQIDEVVNDDPACIQPTGAAILLNSAISDTGPPGDTDGAPRTPHPDP